MNIDHFTYNVTWSSEDNEHVGLCTEFPSLSFLATDPESALIGIRNLVSYAVEDMQSAGDVLPAPLKL